MVPGKNCSDSLLLEPVGVDLDVLVPLSRKIILWKDRLHRALVDTQATIDTRLRIDVQLLNLLKAITLLGWVNAINWTNLNT